MAAASSSISSDSSSSDDEDRGKFAEIVESVQLGEHFPCFSISHLGVRNYYFVLLCSVDEQKRDRAKNWSGQTIVGNQDKGKEARNQA